MELAQSVWFYGVQGLLLVIVLSQQRKINCQQRQIGACWQRIGQQAKNIAGVYGIAKMARGESSVTASHVRSIMGEVDERCSTLEAMHGFPNCEPLPHPIVGYVPMDLEEDHAGAEAAEPVANGHDPEPLANGQASPN